MFGRNRWRVSLGILVASTVALVLVLAAPGVAAAQEGQQTTVIEGTLHAEVPGLAQLITADNLAYDVDGNGLDLAPLSHQFVLVTGSWSGEEGASIFVASAVEALPESAMPDHQVVDEMPTLAEEAALVAQAEADGIGHRPGAVQLGDQSENAQREEAQAAANSHLVGSWGSVQNWPVIPIFATLLHDGRVLAYDSVSDRPTEQEPNQSFTRATVWSPDNNSFTDVTVNTGYNIFCSGFASMVNGTVFVAGGNRDTALNGLVQTHTFAPSTNGWSRTANMAYARWYPSVTPLSNTEMLITGGGPAVPEVRQTNGQIRQLTSAAQNYWANRNYPWLQTAPNGQVAFLGPSNQLGYINTGGSGSWQATARRDNVFRGYGSYAMYDPGRVLIAGGATQSSSHDMRSSVVVNLDNNSVSTSGNMNHRRRQHNLTVLADGSVLATGGLSSNAGLVDLNNAVYNAERWNPSTGQWTVMAPEDRARQYHSTALLLPDGRVMSGGGGICGDCQRFGYIQKNTQIFSPPYLFKTDGSGQLASRPTIAAAPSTIGYDRGFTIDSSQASSITKVGLVRVSSVTHSQNQEQRYVPLTFSSSNGRLTIDEPVSTAEAPPGHYMLFILDGDGVPSVAEIVQVIQGGDTGGSDTVTFYRDGNFSGPSWTVSDGTYDIATVSGSPVGNDAISSIRIPDGYSVRACQNSGGGGTCETYTSSASSVGGLNDQISYVEVSENNNVGACNGLDREAEDAVLAGDMQVGSDGAASGGKFVHAPDGSGYSGSAGNDKAEYCFTVDTAGTYKITASVRGLDGGSDSFHVTVGGGTHLWDVPTAGSYVSDEVSDRGGDNPVLVSLPAGENRIGVHLREDAARLDTISLELVSTGGGGGSCGGLTQQAEDGTLSGSLEVSSSGSASGGAFIHAPDGSGNVWSVNNNQADYCFDISNPGLYRISAQVRGLDGGSDSFFVTSGGDEFLWDVPNSSGFVSDNVSDRLGDDPSLVDLNAGEQTISVHLREDGTQLDSIQLIRVGDGNGGGGGSCDGLIQEAEDGVVSGSMRVVSSGAASGGAYVDTADGSGNQGAANSSKVDLCFTVATAGNYRIDAKVQGLSGGSDSFFVTVNGTTYLWDLTTSAGFVTNSVSDRGGANPVIVNLGAGQNIVSFHLREDGTRLDSVTLIQS